MRWNRTWYVTICGSFGPEMLFFKHFKAQWQSTVLILLLLSQISHKNQNNVNSVIMYDILDQILKFATDQLEKNQLVI